jgi:hypothetical protein
MPDSVQYRALQDVIGSIQGANLETLNNSNVAVAKVATDRGRTTANGGLPAVLIAPLPEKFGAVPGVEETNTADLVSYNFVIGIVAADNQSSSLTNLGQYLNWRENIRLLFNNLQLGPLTVENVTCRILPGETIDQRAYYINLFSSWLVLQVICREARTQAS